MAGKKPGSKIIKSKETPKVTEHRPAAHPAAANSRKAVAATSVKAEGKTPKKAAGSSHEPAEDVPELTHGSAAAHGHDTSSTARLSALAAQEEAEGDDDSESNSLLAGPRNVKPYIAKRGELYMSKEQLSHFQTILSTWKRDLMEEVDRTVTHMKDEAANFPDPNDRATQEEEFSLELRTRDRERKLIRKIDEALKRTEDGSYGYCLETGEEIGIKRLEARPVATLSIEAQERRERRERQYGDRDDRYR
jgi:DnaK suppressor protein